MRTLRLVVAASALPISMVFLTLADAADIRVEYVPPSGGTAVISLNGEIVAGDTGRLKALADAYSSFGVLLASDGGSALEGMEIGEYLRSRNASAAIIDGQRCASACASAFLGASVRGMQSHALLGAHAAYRVDANGAASESGAVNALAGAYLTKLGFSYGAVLAMTSAGPQGMKWMTPEEARAAGLGVETLDGNFHVAVAADGSSPGAQPQPAPPQPPAQPIAPPARSLPGSFPLVPGGLQGTVSDVVINVAGPQDMRGVITAADVGDYCATRLAGDAQARCRSDYAAVVGALIEVNADCGNRMIAYSFRGEARAAWAVGAVTTTRFDVGDATRMLNAQWRVLCPTGGEFH